MTTPPRRLTLTVSPDLAGRKVDFLLRRCLGLSGTLVRRAKWLPGGITLDGEPVHTDHTAGAGQVLSVLVGDLERRSGVLPAPGPLDIVYEDEDLIVLNKAPGVLVHPGHGHFSDTLGNFLLHYYDSRGLTADFHPVHRLDKGTSGLLVVAKHAHAQEVLKGQLHTAAFRREYLAVCRGAPSPAAGGWGLLYQYSGSGRLAQGGGSGGEVLLPKDGRIKKLFAGRGHLLLMAVTEERGAIQGSRQRHPCCG